MTQLIKHYTAGAFILTDTQPTKVLLVNHRKLGKWLQPGGHQEEGENPLEAAIREVQEETGLDIAPYLETPRSLDDHVFQLPLPTYLLEEKIPAHGDQPEHYHLDQLYVVRIPEQAVSHNQRESSDIQWFTHEQLEDLPLYDNTRILLQQEMIS